MSETNVEQKADAENVKNIENVEKAENVDNVFNIEKAVNVKKAEEDSDDDDFYIEKADNVKKADIVKKADNVTKVEDDSDDDDFYTNFETFLSKSNSTTATSNLIESSTANNSSIEIDRQILSEKVIDSSNNPDKVEVDLLMADIDNCLVENEVRIRLQLGWVKLGEMAIIENYVLPSCFDEVCLFGLKNPN
jgi:hypothetical protein